jgi:hypothetical protein
MPSRFLLRVESDPTSAADEFDGGLHDFFEPLVFAVAATLHEAIPLDEKDFGFAVTLGAAVIAET